MDTNTNSPANESRKLWFRAKSYGWGWQPITWQGWVSTAIYIAFLILIAVRIDENAPAIDILIDFAAPIILITLLFSFLCYGTGEKPEWRWGAKE